jgi:alkaline phosphatase
MFVSLSVRDVWNKRASDELNKHLNLKENNNVAKNIVMFMGDGMGIPTVTGARIYKGQLAGRSGEETVLSFEEFPYVGLAKVSTLSDVGRRYLCGWGLDAVIKSRSP